MSLNSISNYQKKEHKSELTAYPTIQIDKEFPPFSAAAKNSSKNLDFNLHDFSIYRWPEYAKADKLNQKQNKASINLAENDENPSQLMYNNSVAKINSDRSWINDNKKLMFKLSKKPTKNFEPTDICTFINMPELTRSQILSRLSQIREYLKQAYSMLSNLKSKIDTPNRNNKIIKLSSLIEHMKDQEKGYLDLLNSFSKFQQLTSNLYPKSTSGLLVSKFGNNRFKTAKDESEIAEFDKSFFDFNKTNQKITDSQTNSSQENEFKISKMNQNEVSSNNCSMSGSFISDTIIINDGLEAINQSKELKNSSSANTQVYQEEDEEMSENDQDLNDDETEIGKSVTGYQIQEKCDLIRALNGDLETLEQLKEQKKLLRSIQLRKEELKALEGRRKALDALKKQSTFNSETDLDMNQKTNSTEIDEDKNLREFETFLNSLKTKNCFTARKSISQAYLNNPDVSIINNGNEMQQISNSKTLNDSTNIFKTEASQIGEQETLSDTTSDYYSSINQPIDKNDLKENNQEEFKSELLSKLIDLNDKERKLEELYSLQSRLSGLKQMISKFNIVKDEHNYENSHCCDILNNSFKFEENLVGAAKEFQNGEKLNKNNNFYEQLNNKNNENDEIKEKMTYLDNQKDSNLDLENEKRKLIVAKEKLSDLQKFIEKLEKLATGINRTQTIENFQKETESSDEEHETDKSSQERERKSLRLSELERNKQHFLNLLNKKEAEMNKLMLGEKVTTIGNAISTTGSFTEINTSLEPATLSTKPQHSPSDLLWSQMKRQLNMRESMRNKKKELEDLIKDEHQVLPLVKQLKKDRIQFEESQIDEESDLECAESVSSEKSSQDFDNDSFQENNYQAEDENMNGYENIFLYNKLKPAQKNGKNLDNSLGKKTFSQKQQQQHSDNEPIQTTTIKSTLTGAKTLTQSASSQQCCDSEDVENNGLLFKAAKTNANSVTNKIKNMHLEEKINEILELQKKANEYLQKGYDEFLEHRECHQQHKKADFDENVNNPTTITISSLQMQTQQQFQMQQMMISQLSLAFSEITAQKTEIAKLNETIQKINERVENESKSESKLNKITPKSDSDSQRESTNSNNKVCVQSKNQENGCFIDSISYESQKPISAAPYLCTPKTHKHPQALPGYFYNSKLRPVLNLPHTHTSISYNFARHESNYTDDFEELEEQEELFKNKTGVELLWQEASKVRSSSTTAASSLKSYRGRRDDRFKRYAKDSSCSSSSSNSPNRSHSSLSVESTTLALKENLRVQNVTNDRKFSSISTPSSFESMREQIYSEVAALITQNESRPFYLLNLFKELQLLRDKNSRDQCLKNIFNISNRKTSSASSVTDQDDENDDTTTTATTNSAASFTKNEKNIDNLEKNYLLDCQNDLNSAESISQLGNDSLSNTVIFVKNGNQSMCNKTLYSKECNTEDDSQTNSMKFSCLDIKNNENDENIGIQSDDTHNENKIDKQSLSSSYQTFSENESQNISEKNLSEFFFETKETSELVSKYKGIKLLKNLSSLITNKLSDIKSNDETNSEEDNKNDKDLEKVILEFINDDLVCDEEALISPQSLLIKNFTQKYDMESSFKNYSNANKNDAMIECENKSERTSSGSDQFVMVNGAEVDVKDEKAHKLFEIESENGINDIKDINKCIE